MKKRPVNLNLTTIRFPLTALASITHRMSGVVLFLLIPLILWVFGESLTSSDAFEYLADLFNFPVSKVVIWVVLSLISLHVFGGIRHLLVDMHIGENIRSGRIAVITMWGAWLTTVAALGAWLW
jgi:succinate dehydrogenase / fumarate reductase, cytochrome b subunit